MTRKQAAFETTYDSVKTLVFREAGFYPYRSTVQRWLNAGVTTAQEIAERITRAPEESIRLV